MKRKLAISILPFILCVSLLFVFTACGNKITMEGTWGLTAMEINGEDYLATMAELATSMGEEFDPASIMNYEFLKDGTMKMTSYGDEEAETGTYTLNGKELTISSDGESIKGIVEGNTLVIEEIGEDMSGKMTFTKK